MGTVFQIQRFSLYDGPGVRTVVFLKGCPLRCIWCHNPEGLLQRSQIFFDQTKCIGCMDCVSVCGGGCHSLKNGLHLYNRANCSHCGRCTSVCCSNALCFVGEEMTPEAVMEQVLRDRAVYEETGGGLTLSGGEPFFQAEFTIRLLQLAKEYSLHTAVETSGYTEPSVICRAAAYTDLFLYDYKMTDDSSYKKFCGVSNQVILSNLTLLNTLNAHVILRCPIVPGYNDTQEHIYAIAEIAKTHTCVKQIHLEPYHRLGLEKARKLNVDVADIMPPESGEMELYRQSVQSICGKPVRLSI